MEETKKEEKLSYEQLEKFNVQLQNELVRISNQLKTIDFASMRLNWLFKVLEYEANFPIEFVERCAQEVRTLLTIDTEEEDKEEDKEDSDK